MPWARSGVVQEASQQTALLQGRAGSQQPDTLAASSEREVRKSKRPTPGFGRQYVWCLSRVALQRTREPLTVFTDYAIFALTGDLDLPIEGIMLSETHSIRAVLTFIGIAADQGASHCIKQRPATKAPQTFFPSHTGTRLASVPAGLALGTITERGRGTIMHFDVDTLYNNVALGLLTTVSALRTFGLHRVVFFREASSGLNKWALPLHTASTCP